MARLNQIAAPLLAIAALTGAASAQSAIDFVIDPAGTAFTYSGSTSLGPIVGNPPAFGLSGNTGVLLTGPAGAAPASARFTGTGAALVAPDINATIPNPLPFLPALATISITNLSFSFSSPVASIDSAGNATLQITTTATSGTFTVTPLTGSPTVNDLTGSQSTPQTFNANISVLGTNTRIQGPLAIDFQFTDSGSGITGSLSLNGTFTADHTARSAQVYCNSYPNSTGTVATLGATGTTSLAAADLVLQANNVPNNQFMLFILSDTPALVPFFANSQGNLCLGGSIIRLNSFLQNSGTTGSASLPVPFGMVPGAALDIGETWHFQAWFRDFANGAPTSNTTDGLRVTFAP